MEGEFILNLKEVDRRDADMVGAKAANLGELAGAGFPVPDGLVLTTVAFDRFFRANGFDSESSPALVALADIPEEVRRALLEHAAPWDDVPLAVRSSSVAEDLADASFAGQYQTVLGVRGKDALLKAVRTCWSSALSARARVYQEVQGRRAPPRMAVLVQRMVAADAAGVAFTVNPVTGDRGVTLVSAVRGLGERLVSGKVTPDEWVIKDGEATLLQAPEGAIDRTQAVDIAKLARASEAHFDSPQDIEWALAKGRLHLLQSRPVTALGSESVDSVEEPVVVPDGFWEREATHAPQPWTPMTAGLLYPLRNPALKRAFDEFGFLLETLEFREIGGWEYARLVPLGGKDRPAPPAWLFWLLTRLVPQLRARVAKCVDAVRSEKAIGFVRRWNAKWQPELEARIAELRGLDLTALDDRELDEHTAMAVALFKDGNDIHMMLHTAIGSLLGSMVLTCRDFLGWHEDRIFDMLGGLSKKSTEPSLRLADLARLAQQRATVRNILENLDESSVERLAVADPEFNDAFVEYLGTYGCRALRYEIGDPTLGESPVLVLGLIQSQLVVGYDAEDDASALERKRNATVEEARVTLSRRSGEERERFERALEQAEKAYPVREDNEFYTYSAPLGLIRYAALEIGRRLAERRQLVERADVFLLRMEEARSALRDGGDLVALVSRRKGERAWVLAHPGPATYGKDPGPPPSFGVLPPEARLAMESALWYVARIFAQEETRQAEKAGGALQGIAASAGQYQGTSRVVMSESEFGKLEAGDVLVCPITSPVWSVLFPSIGALVTDTGGILSHPAIIAREYRVPAVVATGRATSLLRDGQTVRVDGSTGTVEVMS